jgi:hypothetical protein
MIDATYGHLAPDAEGLELGLLDAYDEWFWAPKPARTAMRMRGLEPPRGFPHTDLNRARLPIPPHPRGQMIVAVRWLATKRSGAPLAKEASERARDST